MTHAAHRQAGYTVRFDWGRSAALELAPMCKVVIVVDVLSFSTTVCVAAERGISVLPFPGGLGEDRLERVEARRHAAEHDAELAMLQPGGNADQDTAYSLSPAVMARAPKADRVVVCSPNGAAISHALIDSPVAVAVGCLRNRHAVARWAQDEAAESRGAIAVIAAGERWADQGLRPALEDLYGAGAIISALSDLGLRGTSPEADQAADAFAATEGSLAVQMRSCASGVELVDQGREDDVRIAAQVDATSVVPALEGIGFTHW